MLHSQSQHPFAIIGCNDVRRFQTWNNVVNFYFKFVNVCPRGRENSFNKKAVLSQRWPRDARYISRLWAVAEIWPVEIIQDGGGRHLEFVRTENIAIRSAVPENPTLDQTWSGSDHPLQRYGHSRMLGHMEPPFWGEGKVVGGQRWHH